MVYVRRTRRFVRRARPALRRTVARPALRRPRRMMRRPTRIPRSLPIGGYPRTHLARLRYVEEVTLNPPPAGAQEYIFRCNSVYDPNQSGGGHQPLGFDQNMANYFHYVVIGSKIKAQFINTGTLNIAPAFIGIHITPDTATLDFFTTLLERPDQSKAMMATQFSTSRANIVKASWSARRFFGKRFQVSNPDFGGTSGTNPLEQSFYRVWASSIGGNDPGTYTVLVTIEYIVLFTERIPLPAS